MAETDLALHEKKRFKESMSKALRNISPIAREYVSSPAKFAEFFIKKHFVMFLPVNLYLWAVFIQPFKERLF